VVCMSDKKYSIGAIGEKEIVSAFRAIGMKVACVETEEEITLAVHRMATSGVAVIFMTESCAKRVPETLERYKNDPYLAIIPIPGSFGSDGFGMAKVTANVEKAIGANILLTNEEE